jgi:hypothetical protein
LDYKQVFTKLIAAFDKQAIRYALIGGFALGLWGVVRGTVDIDFLVHRDDMPHVDAMMQALGYECRYKSDNVTQYVSPIAFLGSVDFLHAFRELSVNMLQKAESKKIFNGLLSIRVLRPDDIIALKLQAIKNDPARREADIADIKMLLSVQKDEIDYALLEEYGRVLGMALFVQQLVKEYAV